MSEVMTSRIGRFEILDSLGDSVAGNHYRAFDPATNRNVAVETFRLATLPSDAARDAFVQGLKKSAQLLHPRIASVFDVGIDNDVAYVAGEDLSGRTLDRAMLEYGPFELAEILPVIRQVGAALDHAHAQGVVHGGLEPGRVLLLENGDVKVTGFGTSFPQVKTPQGAHTFIGDPKYFSPERVRGEELSHRADIFSFGSIVYELLTGQAPFESDSLITELYRLVNEPHRPASEVRPGLPEGVDEALGYALAKQAKERYLSCATLIDSLEALVPVKEEVVQAPATDAAEDGVAADIQYCDQCGSELQAKMKFCWSCGSTVLHGEPGAAERAEPAVGGSPEQNVVKIEAVPAPAPPAMKVGGSPATVKQSGPVVEPPAAIKPVDRNAATEPMPVAAPVGPGNGAPVAGLVTPKPPVAEPEVVATKPEEAAPKVEPAAPEPEVAASSPVAAGPASTAKVSAKSGSRATVPMKAASVLGDLGRGLDVKAVARTEVAPAVGVLPPPLSGYAMSTGTKDLPAPGAVIDAAPAKPGLLRAMVPIAIFVIILLCFAALGFWFAPRFLAPKPGAQPAVEEPAPAESAPVESAPAESAPAEAAPADATPATSPA